MESSVTVRMFGPDTEFLRAVAREVSGGAEVQNYGRNFIDLKGPKSETERLLQLNGTSFYQDVVIGVYLINERSSDPSRRFSGDEAIPGIRQHSPHSEILRLSSSLPSPSPSRSLFSFLFDLLFSF
eukprot:TRINITY_DN7905_c0_g1_i1.p1 TRINITY_DN7905_c0_g1~~TRINITY_DN7905_c0_g1_i1.p1  ORF type:complete len:138 (-),score=51.77 TRINITY_DN7905_c0_g1_i1:76-453(-)